MTQPSAFNEPLFTTFGRFFILAKNWLKILYENLSKKLASLVEDVACCATNHKQNQTR